MTYSAEVLADSPLAYWKFDETVAVDSGSNATNWPLGIGAVINGSPLPSDGGYSIHGDGSHVIASLSSIPTGLSGSNVTIEAWVTIPAGNVNGVIATIGNDSTGWAVGVGNTTFDNAGKNLILLTNGIAWNTTGYTFSTGTHHVMIVRGSGNSVTCYVDGTSVATPTLSSPATATTITAVGGSPSRSLSSTVQVDNVAFFSSALSGSRVTAHYNSGTGDNSAVSADSPVVWLKFDSFTTSTVVTTAADSSGNARHMTLNNSPTVGSASLLGDGSGFSIDLDGTNDYASIAGASWMTGVSVGLTVEARVRPDSGVLSAGGFFASQWGTATCWLLGVTSAGKAQAAVFTAGTQKTATGSTTLSAGTTYTIALKWTSGGNVEVFVDGASDGSTSATGTLTTSSSQSIDVGRAAGANGAGLSWDGRVAHVSVTASSLSSSRLLARHNAAIDTGPVNATINAPVLTATSDMLDPTVSIVNNATIAAPLLAATSDMLDPTVVTEGDVNVAAPALTATSDMLDPTVDIASNATVLAPVLTATSDMLDPVVWGGHDVSIAAPVLTATSDMLDPTVVATTTMVLDFKAKADMSVSLSSLTLTTFALNLQAKADFTLATPKTVTYFAFDFAAKASMNVVFPRPHTVDPVTGLPQYRLVAVQADGTRLGELPRAVIGDIVEELGLDGTRLDFTLPKYDATNSFVLPTRGEPIPEVQVWRGPNIETWQKVDGARPNEGTIDYDASGLAGYLDGRRVGKFPKTNLLVNGAFTESDYGWSYGFDAGSIPAANPNHEVVTVDFFGEKRKALKLSGADTFTTTKLGLETAAVFVPNSATFLSGGAALVTAKANEIPAGTAAITIEGHTAYAYIDGDFGDGLALSLARANAAKPLVQAVHPTATITTVGKGRFEPVASNDTHAGQAQNRRVEFHYTTTVTADADAAQYARGSLTTGTITVPTSTHRAVDVTFRGWALLTNFLSTSKTGYGVYISIAKQSAPTVIVDEAHSTLDEQTPTDDWTRHTATVTVPADGITYIFTVRLYAPGGDVLWTESGVYPSEALNFPAGTDRALIIKGLVEHGQDPAVGKLGDTPILIGTRTPLSGKLTKKTYLYHERREILDAVNEHSALYQGVDLRLGFDETTRWVETHSPRLGTEVSVTLALGSNVIAYESRIDVSTAGTRYIAQELESSGADREEGVATDMSGLGGVLLERLAYAEPETPVTELDSVATSALKRYGQPVASLTVTIGKVGPQDSELTSWMLDHVKVGDVVDVDIQDGPIVHLGPHRVIRRALTPDTDTLRYSLTPEV